MENLENKMIYKHNDLVQASYRLSISEQRVIAVLASLVNPNDNEFKPYRFAVKDFIKLIDTKSKNMYQVVEKLTDGLRNKGLTIRKNENGTTSILKINWLSSIEYFPGEGVVELCFDPKLKPVLLQLKTHFTSYKLKDVMTFRSTYSFRIYELLKQYLKLGERLFLLEDLRNLLGIEPEEYKLYGDFKRKILLTAQKDINEKTDVEFDFEEIKTGRKVGKIRFFIKNKAKANSLKRPEHEINVADIEKLWQVIVAAGGEDVSRSFIKEQLVFIQTVLNTEDPVEYFLEKVTVLKQQTRIKKTIEDALVYFIKNDSKPGTNKSEVTEVKKEDNKTRDKKGAYMRLMYGQADETETKRELKPNTPKLRRRVRSI